MCDSAQSDVAGNPDRGGIGADPLHAVFWVCEVEHSHVEKEVSAHLVDLAAEHDRVLYLAALQVDRADAVHQAGVVAPVDSDFFGMVAEVVIGSLELGCLLDNGFIDSRSDICGAVRLQFLELRVYNALMLNDLRQNELGLGFIRV